MIPSFEIPFNQLIFKHKLLQKMTKEVYKQLLK